jgi:TRAP-type C4-dicarboxylate transport system permease small subunit
MARSSTDIKITVLVVALGLPLVLSQPAYAATAGVSNVENFIRSIITVFAGLAGLVATGFLVAGGFTYITSSGNPEHLDRAKRTITYALIGLAITIGAFVISNIVTTLASSAFGG